MTTFPDGTTKPSPTEFACKLVDLQHEAERCGYHQCARMIQAAQDHYAADIDDRYKPRQVLVDRRTRR